MGMLTIEFRKSEFEKLRFHSSETIMISSRFSVDESLVFTHGLSAVVSMRRELADIEPCGVKEEGKHLRII